MVTLTRSHGFLIVLLLVSTILVTHNLNEGEFWYQDDARHTMNGLFYLDFFTDHPSNPIQYTMEYFARYPAISIVHYPPIFYLVEALFFALFGFSIATAKLTVLFFYLLFTAAVFYLFKSLYTEEIAFYASLLTISLPFMVLWGRTVMLEIPHLALFTLALYFFHSYLKSEKPRSLYFAAVFAGLAIVTKILALPILLVFFLYALFNKRQLFLKKEAWVSVGIIFAIVSPWIAILFLYGRWSLSLVTNFANSEAQSFVQNILYYPRFLFTQHFTASLFVFGVFGFSFLLYRMVYTRSDVKSRDWLILWWILSVYLSFTIISQKHARYPILYLPAFILLGVVGWKEVTTRWNVPWAFHGLLILLVVAHLYLGYTVAYPYKDGYFDAGATVAENYPGTILFVGDNNGNFIYSVRKNADTFSDFVILRADLVLTSFAIFTYWDTSNYVESIEDFYARLDEYGVDYIAYQENSGLQQELANQGIYSYQIAGQAVSDYGHFEKVATFPIVIKSSSSQLVVYRYLHDPKTKDTYTFYVPTLGQNVTVRTPLKP